MTLENKNALVIGAGTAGDGWGIGKACAVQLARKGARVVCFDLKEDLARQTAAIIRSEDGIAEAICGNATNSDDVRAAIATAVETFGGLDILVNNVGAVVKGSVVELAEDEWERGINLNLKSSFLSMKHAIPAMIERGGGSVVNISSISSIRYLGKDYAAYYTGKAGLNHLTRVTAAHYASDQVRVNAVLPGLMDTPMAKDSARRNWNVPDSEINEAWKRRAERIPMGWMGDAFDVARAVSFLASDDARFITGQMLVIDGGMTLRS